ncbi:unnamed protein product, partial [Tilletia caries]
MPSNLTFWAARPAPVRRSTRSSSVPVLEPIPNSEAPDMRQLAELTKANPAAATAVRGLIKSGQSVGAALQLMSAAVAAAPTTSTVAGNLRPPTTPTGQVGAGRSRRMSAPPSPSPIVGQKRQADADSVPRKKQSKQSVHRALSPTLDGDGLDIDYGATNRNAFEESWPSSKVELKVKNLDFVAMWYFTPAGCKHAAKERKDGATRPMIYHSDGTFKPAAPPIGEVEDWFLDPHVFRAATDKWVKVAIKMGVSERMQQSMAMLNSAICNHDDWETNPAPLMRWHHHQRETWARDRHAPACYPLEALNPDTYDGIKVKGAVAASSAAEKRAREAEAAIAEMRQEIATLASQRLGDNFRRAGGAATRLAPVKPARMGQLVRSTTTPSTRGCPSPTPGTPCAWASTRGNVTTHDADASTAAHGARVATTATNSAPEPPTPANEALGPTPLKAAGWSAALQTYELGTRYPTIVAGITSGFDVGLPRIDRTFIPPNHKSATKDPDTVRTKIDKELAAGRYSGPFTRAECELTVGGPFQCSPISLAPKPPDGWRFIQDAFFPLDDPDTLSINAQIQSDDWPCTYAGIATVIWQ